MGKLNSVIQPVAQLCLFSAQSRETTFEGLGPLLLLYGQNNIKRIEEFEFETLKNNFDPPNSQVALNSKTCHY